MPKTKKPRKSHEHCFSKQKRATKKPRKRHEKGNEQKRHKYTVGGPNGPKWTKMDHFGLFLVSQLLNPARNKAVLTKMVAWTILVHFGPAHFPTVPRPLPRSALPQNGAIPPPWYLVSHRHICAISQFATYGAIRIVRITPHEKTSTEEFCDIIATAIARCEKYCCWASKGDRNFEVCSKDWDLWLTL